MLAAWPFQFDLIKTIFFDNKTRRQHTVLTASQVGRCGFIEHKPASGCAHRGKHAQAHLSPTQDHNIPAILNQSRFQAGVRRKVILELNMLDIRQVNHIDSEGIRPHTSRLDVIVGLSPHIEQNGLKTAGRWRFAVFGFLRNQRHLLVRRAGTTPHKQIHVVGFEAKQLRGDVQI